VNKPFVADDFSVPEGLVTGDFRLRMLTVNDVVKDFDAVMSSMPELRMIFPDWGDWPEDLTLEQNLIDLGWHQKEFQRRSSFAYTVVSLDEARVLGCVYVVPPERAECDAEVYLWARESPLGSEADQVLEKAVRSWIAREWPFDRVAYPGRTNS
jgi:hypothetical protein